jgi:hypothetical protein|tara:strand:+ start:1239 stop:1532 length:294 start_codon:yes stop_codon:yes gene_type:complete
MARNHLINGKLVPFTAEEETARDAEEAAWAAKQTELEKTLYQRKRTGEAATPTEDTQYLPIGEQLDLLYKDIVAGTVTASGAFATAIKATKDKYPKP